MASVLTASPYLSQSPVYTRSPQPPPSPPADPHTSRTLPSIQSLIGMERHSGAQDPKGKQRLVQRGGDRQLTRDAGGAEMQQHAPGDDSSSSGHRPQVYGQPTVSNPNNRPLSPPIDPQLFDTRVQSPRASSSPVSQFGSASLHSTEAHPQRQPPTSSGHLGMAPPQPGQSPYRNSPYPESPSASSSYPYSSTAVPPPQSMYNQRPLPSSFPPMEQPGNTTPSDTNGASPIDPNTPNQWQHHHYISPSSSAQFPGQAQDRYVCQVCNKAFSRPSSLRIHSHSHTGEKPFLCPHKGCGKAFSVRSNMKRHERGCHGGGGGGGGSGGGGVSSPGSQQ